MFLQNYREIWNLRIFTLFEISNLKLYDEISHVASQLMQFTSFIVI